MAEQSDAIRGVAETLLRQNGFEVISVGTADKALEVLNFTRPDLVIIGGELRSSDGLSLYERVKKDPKGSQIAMLIFDAPNTQLSVPPEMIIPRPFDADDFLQKVTSLTAAAEKPASPPPENPLTQAELDDDFLDAALGIDRIDVTDSEVMDKTTITSKKSGTKPPEKFIGFDNVEQETEKHSDSTKVETILIQDSDTTDIRHPQPSQAQASPPGANESDELEILTDQYGLANPEALHVEVDSQVHDYEWFIGEMRKEGEAPASSPSPTPSSPSSSQSVPPSEALDITSPASVVDPITPAPASPSPSQPAPNNQEKVKQFLDEFKKEVEKFHSDEMAHYEKLEEKHLPASQQQPSNRSWQELTETFSPDEIHLFTQAFRKELAEKIAEKIVAKIDQDELITLLKNEIIAYIRNK